MRRYSILIFYAAVIWAARAETPSFQREMVSFTNGDFLLGRLEAIHPGRTLTWQQGAVSGPLEFRLANVREILLSPRALAGAYPTGQCIVQLSNNDELYGAIASCDKDSVTLETWYGGRLSFPRKYVRAISPAHRAVVFDGLKGLEGWTRAKVTTAGLESGDWEYKNGAFYATKSASIARPVDLPDMARVEFDVEWRGLLQIALALYTDNLQPINLATKDTEPNFTGFYSLQINSYYANLMPVKKDTILQPLGQAPIQSFSDQNQVHIAVVVNRAKRSIALWMNDKFVKEWIDPDGFAGEGRGIRFVHQGQGLIRMSKLRILEWEGAIESKSSGGSEDQMLLKNGDVVSGRLLSIAGGVAKCATSERTLEVPFSRVEQINLAQTEQVPVVKDSVRMTFESGGTIHLQLDSMEDGKVKGTSAAFGAVEMMQQAFTSLRFR